MNGLQKSKDSLKACFENVDKSIHSITEKYALQTEGSVLQITSVGIKSC